MPRWLDRLLDPSAVIARKLEHVVADPAARLVEEIESFAPPIIAIVVATGLQASLPQRVGQLRWIFVGLSVLLLLAVLVVNPLRIERRHKPLRAVLLAVVAALSIGNAIAGAELVVDLVNGEGIRDAGKLLLTGGAIWLTNVIVFSLWYWLFDRGGPYVRMHQVDPFPAFMFPQMDKTELAPPQWKPAYVDYLYLSFTNAMAFSPTDVMPLKHWTKLTMLLESLISLMVAVLVIARAVNIFG